MFLYNALKISLFIIFFPVLASASNPKSTLQKLGEGTVYYLKFIKVYDASLFGSENAMRKNILSSTVSKCLHLAYEVDIEKSIIVESATAILSRQFPQEVLARFDRDIDQLHQSYQDVQKGDRYTLCYDRDTSITTLAFNDAEVVSVTSPGFAEIYLSIWLGETEPLDENLRDDLLSRVPQQEPDHG